MRPHPVIYIIEPIAPIPRVSHHFLSIPIIIFTLFLDYVLNARHDSNGEIPTHVVDTRERVVVISSPNIPNISAQ